MTNDKWQMKNEKKKIMLLHIPSVLTVEQVAHCRQKLEKAEWVDGRVTAGHQSARAKENLQLPEDHPVAQELGELIVSALQNNQLFMAAALPLKVLHHIVSVRIFLQRCFSPHPTNTMAASW
jgi:predicted 2-oxoglutarate/Fe(II)-dependent dioxygenase YbiX